MIYIYVERASLEKTSRIRNFESKAALQDARPRRSNHTVSIRTKSGINLSCEYHNIHLLLKGPSLVVHMRIKATMIKR